MLLIATPALDLSPLAVGSMLVVPRGSRMHLPGLPDVPIHGTAWVTEASGAAIRFHEVARMAGMPAVFDMSLVRVGAREVDYVAETTVGGVRMPTMRKRFELVDAGLGWMELANPEDPDEPHSSLRMTDGGLHVQVIGPHGFTDDRTERVVQPGQPGYVPMPA